MASLLSSLFARFSNPSPTFAHWAATTTQVEIHTLLLQVLQHGDAETGLASSISAPELAHFTTTISSISPSDSSETEKAPRQIPISTFLSRLASLHPRHASSIAAASHPLTRLVQAHASFPFPPDYAAETLSEDELLRATILLTSNCDSLFRAAGWSGEAVTVRERTVEKRLGFIFRVLVEGPAVKATAEVDDVLDVLCRVAYPRVKDSSGDLARRDVRDLVPVAGRLLGRDGEGNGDGVVGEARGRRVGKGVQEGLGRLVAKVNRRDVGGITGEEGMTEDEFMSWAIKVNLLGALDKLFQAFLQD